MGRVKVALFGGRVLGYRSLQILDEYRDRVDTELVISNREDGLKDSDWNPPLIPLAKDLGFLTMNPRSLKNRRVADRLKESGVEVVLNSFCTRIVPAKILELPRLRCVNFHYGKLPEYAGRFIVTHIILNGEISTCATAHYMDEDIDTGDIIYEEPVPVEPNDTARSLYFRCTDAAEVLFRRILNDLVAGRELLRRRQEGSKTYYRFEEPNKCRVDPSWDGQTIQRFIRAVTFEPISRPWIEVRGRAYDIIPRS